VHLKIISDELGYVPSLEEVVLMAIEDSDADEMRRD